VAVTCSSVEKVLLHKTQIQNKNPREYSAVAIESLAAHCLSTTREAQNKGCYRRTQQPPLLVFAVMATSAALVKTVETLSRSLALQST
jgi:hypothetical protein